MALLLTYNDPLAAVFLRVLAWEISVRPDNPPTVTELVGNQIQTARQELGLAKTVKGAPHAFLAKLRHARKPLLTTGRPPRPIEAEWTRTNAWRLFCIPPHSAVRQLSDRPVFSQVTQDVNEQPYKQFTVRLRNPAIPDLQVYVGDGPPKGNSLEGQRGVYFLRVTHGFYLGQTRELPTRMSQHYTNMNPKWWVFISSGDGHPLPVDALEAAEALLISYWNEVSHVTNQQRGADKKPDFGFLQQAILLVEAASAVMVWLMREKKRLKKDLGGFTSKNWTIPFKDCTGWHWPRCYLEVPKG